MEADVLRYAADRARLLGGARPADVPVEPAAVVTGAGFGLALAA